VNFSKMIEEGRDTVRVVWISVVNIQYFGSGYFIFIRHVAYYEFEG